MNFKLIDAIQANSLYPNDYNESTLKAYKLHDIGLNTSFRYCYSYYRYYLEDYLNRLLNLQELEEKIMSMFLGNDRHFLYKDICALNYKYVFIRNNIFLDRLNTVDFDNFKNYINDKNYTGIYEIVKNTYQKLITFDVNINPDKDVIYEINNPSMVVKNNSLVIGILLNEKSEYLEDYFKEKEKEYSSILNIPVSILIYNDETIKNNNIYIANNLLEKEEKEALNELKKYDKYIPIGSVVMLKEAWRKIMITGYEPINPETNEKMYDYMACLYPEGILNAEYNVLFNHDDIKKIFSIGLEDDEYKSFIKELLEE